VDEYRRIRVLDTMWRFSQSFLLCCVGVSFVLVTTSFLLRTPPALPPVAHTSIESECTQLQRKLMVTEDALEECDGDLRRASLELARRK
jgi:hypothetical protein